MRHIDGSQGDVAVEWLHGKAVAIQDIFLTNLDHNTSVGEHAERLIQHVTGERVENDIDSSATSRSQDLVTKGCVAGVEDVVVL